MGVVGVRVPLAFLCCCFSVGEGPDKKLGGISHVHDRTHCTHGGNMGVC